MALTTGVNVAARPGRLERWDVRRRCYRPLPMMRRRVVLADTAVDRHHRDRRYAPAGLIGYLDAGVR